MKKLILLVAILISTSLICGAEFSRPRLMQSSTHEYPKDFPGQTLDQAIHNETVNDGDTICVRGSPSGYEHLNVSRSIVLEGSLGSPTILDGGGYGTVVKISAANVTLRDFTIQNGQNGVQIIGGGDSTLLNNTIMSNKGNGISITNSGNNVLRNNTLVGNRFNFGVYGDVGNELQDFIHDVGISNTVNGRPIYYCVNKTGGAIPADAGYVALVNSTSVTVENLDLTYNLQGILLAYTTNSTIENNTLSYDSAGIELRFSKYNQIRNNTLTNNAVGLYFQSCDNNTIVYNGIEKNNYGVGFDNSFNNTMYRNNFVKCQNQMSGSIDNFDNGREGNYWDDYRVHGGSDLNGDGIGETLIPYMGDYHPLMEPWKMARAFGVSRYGKESDFITLSNSTIASPNWNRMLKLIGFNITSGTAESINITIPRDWLDGPFEIRLNATRLEPSSFSVRQDQNCSHIFLDYNPGTYIVEIIGARVLGYRNGDINGNGVVDIYDAIILANNFNKSDQ